MQITREVFERERHRRYGSSNPERMEMVHWEYLVRNCLNPYEMLKKFGAAVDASKGPDWCFTRMGMTNNVLSDGRSIFIGGEYEAWYDEEFCIYNDIIARGPNDEIAIFGYPRDVFPPTDFHSATLIDNGIIIIGGLGYSDDRKPGHTPVYFLDLSTYRIHHVETRGENPGWIHGHTAKLFSERMILLEGGKVITRVADAEKILLNCEQFEFDLNDLTWRQLTHRNWRQFRLTFFDQAGNRTRPQPEFDPDASFSEDMPCEGLGDRGYRVMVDGIPVTFWDEDSEVIIVVEGALSEDALSAFQEEIMKACSVGVESNRKLEVLV